MGALFRGGSGTIALMLAVRARHKPIIGLLAPLEGALSRMTALMHAVLILRSSVDRDKRALAG